MTPSEGEGRLTMFASGANSRSYNFQVSFEKQRSMLSDADGHVHAGWGYRYEYLTLRWYQSDP